MACGDHILPEPALFTHQRRVADEAGTVALGGRLAGLLGGGEIILLYGELGMGKTRLVQGLCAGLSVTDEVVSPTFTLVNTYTGRLKVHHLDFYRVEPDHDLGDIGVPDILDEIWDGQAVGLVEWPGPLVPALDTGPHLALLAEPGAGPAERVWHLRGVPSVPTAWQDVFSAKGTTAC